MKQNGKYLETVHAKHPYAGGYFTACGIRGITTRYTKRVTCKRCAAKAVSK